MSLDIPTFRQELIQLKEKFLAIAPRATQDDILMLLNAKVAILEHLLIGLKDKGEGIDVKDIKFIIETVSLADIKKSRSEIDEFIVKQAESLQEGQAALMNPEVVKWPYFRNRVYLLGKEGLIPKTIRPVIDGDKFYLAKYKEKEMA